MAGDDESEEASVVSTSESDSVVAIKNRVDFIVCVKEDRACVRLGAIGERFG